MSLLPFFNGYVLNDPVNAVDPYGLEVFGPGMIQNFVPSVNPQETAQLISSGGMIIGGFGVWAGGAAIIGVGGRGRTLVYKLTA